MPHSFGKRARTRDKFSRSFRKHGVPSVSRIMTPYRKGDYVDIVADASVQKGMPYTYYHGRTGRVFNVTKRAIGVATNKVVGNRQIVKRLHVRMEHLRKSRCNEAFLRRVKENDVLHHQAHLQGKSIKTKRIPALPKDGGLVVPEKVLTMEPIPFVETY
eukprot:GHVT01077384.1.p1 GENE.GHVT01077384.1~~GHVT01077384.1.p1  ORF type:complete len:159 (-),score=23.94 GHVT01077384.1:691-1167(-)